MFYNTNKKFALCPPLITDFFIALFVELIPLKSTDETLKSTATIPVLL